MDVSMKVADQEYHSVWLPGLSQREEALLEGWLTPRLGPRFSNEHPDGTWALSTIPGLRSLLTARCRATLLEMRLAEPWNP